MSHLIKLGKIPCKILANYVSFGSCKYEMWCFILSEEHCWCLRTKFLGKQIPKNTEK